MAKRKSRVNFSMSEEPHAIHNTAVEADRNYYAELGAHPHSDNEKLRLAYYAVARRTHPDKAPGHEEEFQRAARAYFVLRNPALHALYRRQLHALHSECAKCSGSGTQSVARGWASVELVPCEACAGSGYQIP